MKELNTLKEIRSGLIDLMHKVEQAIDSNETYKELNTNVIVNIEEGELLKLDDIDFKLTPRPKHTFGLSFKGVRFSSDYWGFEADIQVDFEKSKITYLNITIPRFQESGQRYEIHRELKQLIEQEIIKQNGLQ